MKNKLAKKIINNSIIRPIIPTIKKLNYFFVDNYELYFGLRDELTPPNRMIFVGGGDFKAIGEKWLQYFIKKGDLKTTDSILDVGCGIGRIAVPLTRYLSKEGSYEGIDIVLQGIKWCAKKITPKYPNFHFQIADVYNKKYNPNGKHKSSDYKFPFDGKTFDFVFLTSVFTHMLPLDMENYFSEISRVLKKDGKCIITFFLLNQESLSQMDNEEFKTLTFNNDYGKYRVENKDLPENAISYDESFVLNLYEKYGLKIIEPIHYGSWCGRKNLLFYQDIIVAIKQ